VAISPEWPPRAHLSPPVCSGYNLYASSGTNVTNAPRRWRAYFLSKRPSLPTFSDVTSSSLSTLFSSSRQQCYAITLIKTRPDMTYLLSSALANKRMTPTKAQETISFTWTLTGWLAYRTYKTQRRAWIITMIASFQSIFKLALKRNETAAIFTAGFIISGIL